MHSFPFHTHRYFMASASSMDTVFLHQTHGFAFFCVIFCCEKCVLCLQEMLVRDSPDCGGSYLLGIFEDLPFVHLRITFPRGCSVFAGPDTPYGLYLYFGCESGRCYFGGRKAPVPACLHTLKPPPRLTPFLRSIRA